MSVSRREFLAGTAGLSIVRNVASSEERTPLETALVEKIEPKFTTKYYERSRLEPHEKIHVLVTDPQQEMPHADLTMGIHEGAFFARPTHGIKVQAASMIKIVFALAALDKVHRGEIPLDDDLKKALKNAMYNRNPTTTNSASRYVLEQAGGVQGVRDFFTNYGELGRHVDAVELIPNNGRAYKNRMSLYACTGILEALRAERFHGSELLVNLLRAGSTRLDASLDPLVDRANKTGTNGYVLADMVSVRIPSTTGEMAQYDMGFVLERGEKWEGAMATLKQKRAHLFDEVANVVHTYMPTVL